MKIISIATFLMLIANVSNAEVKALDQSKAQLNEGGVIIQCEAPTEAEQISTEVFNEAFPLWLVNLQTHANEGRIARAHYLNQLIQGIFIVVIGNDKKEAMANALQIQSENQSIMKDALKKAGVDEKSTDLSKACQLIEIGPVAILPVK